MASFETCTYHTITLQPGEQFSLPPGATLLSVTDVGAITSTCDIPPLESLACYIIPVYAADEVGCGTGVWEGGDNASLLGISVAGVYYEFPSPIPATSSGAFYTNLVSDFITSNSTLSGLLLDPTHDADADDACRGGAATVCFKTIPSIAPTIYIQLSTSLVSPSNVGMDTRAYAIPYADFTGTAKCACSLT